MDVASVDGLVSGLVAAYEDGLAFYTAWKQKKEAENHYRRNKKQRRANDLTAAAATTTATARPAASSSAALTTAKCAVSTALSISGPRIRDVYKAGVDALGPDFRAGDDSCRRQLSVQLSLINDRVTTLRAAASAPRAGPVDFGDMFHVFESVRVRSIAAMRDFYRRQAPSRAIPPTLALRRLSPTPGSQDLAHNDGQQQQRLDRPHRRRASDDGSGPDRHPGPTQRQNGGGRLSLGPLNLSSLAALLPPGHVEQQRPQDFDHQTAVWSTTSPIPVFQSEPPSPPLTPTKEPSQTDGASQSAFSWSLPPSLSGVGPVQTTKHGQRRRQQQQRGSITSSLVSYSYPLRPKNSVFSIFCPEAMALQADPARGIPGVQSCGPRRCKCGFRWRIPELPAEQQAVMLKDGFRMTRRFLAKSHCDQSVAVEAGCGKDPWESGLEPAAAGGAGGSSGGSGLYGCVLCTSQGLKDSYASAEHLRVHINQAHTKWQMLHDRDMA